jgi:tetratricopeptide (TPR) repeat protein
MRWALAWLEAAAGRHEPVLALLGEEIARNPQSAAALNNRCWHRAVAGIELDLALADCNAALAIRRTANILDSRGLVHIRRGRFAEAIADYDAALALEPGKADSLYGRGLARLRLGDRAAGEADLAQARALRPRIAEEFRGYGLEP